MRAHVQVRRSGRAVNAGRLVVWVAALGAAGLGLSAAATGDVFNWSGNCGPNTNDWASRIISGDCATSPRYVNNWGRWSCYPGEPELPSSDDDVFIGSGWGTYLGPGEDYGILTLHCDGGLILAGALAVAGAADIHGALTYGGGGTHQPTVLTVAPGATLAITYGGSVNGGAVINQGTGWCDSEWGYIIEADTEFRNEGSLALERGNFTGYGHGGIMRNTGLITKTAYPYDFKLDGLVFENTGTIDLRAGTFTLYSCITTNSSPLLLADGTRLVVAGPAGNLTLQPGTTITGPGLLSCEGSSVYIPMDLTIPNLAVRGGTMDHAGLLTVATRLTMEQGGLAGTGETLISPEAEFIIEGWGGCRIVNQVVTNHGTANWSGGGNVMTAGSVIHNVGTVISGTAWGWGGPGTEPRPIFDNSGTYRSVGSSVTGIAFNNTGLVHVQSNVLTLDPYTQTAGETRVEAGTILDTNSSAMELQGGALRSSGYLNRLINNTGGVFAPGLPVGQTTMRLGFIQGPGGTLEVEIAGTAVGTEYDQVVVEYTGGVGLDGTLRVRLLNGFVPNIGDRFVIIALTRPPNGQFAMVDGQAIDHNRRFVVEYNAADVTLAVAPKARADVDGDGDVDLADFTLLADCMRGPDLPYPTSATCDLSDLDVDADVDLADFALQQRCFSGAGVPADLACGS